MKIKLSLWIAPIVEEAMINFEELQKYTVSQLRTTLTSLGGAPGNKNKQSLIGEIMKIMCGEIAPSRSNRGRPTTAATIVVDELDCQTFTLRYSEII